MIKTTFLGKISQAEEGLTVEFSELDGLILGAPNLLELEEISRRILAEFQDIPAESIELSFLA